MKVLTVDDVTSNPLEGKKVAVIGYGAQGRAQALCFNDSGLDVVVGARTKFYKMLSLLLSRMLVPVPG